MKAENEILSRRSLLKLILGIPIALLATRFAFAKPALQPTPEIQDDEEPTPSQTEGPFYKSQNPERTNLREAGINGTSLTLTGRVLNTKGQPVPGALLDFWQCDADGEYDNIGNKLRGHQHADKDGKYKLETIVPGLYPGRTRHIHVRVQAPKGRILSTQLYFPGEGRNERDGIYDKRLLMKVKDQEGEKLGTFDFVLRV